MLAHADLGAEHILEAAERIRRRRIDSSKRAVTDPALDFAASTRLQRGARRRVDAYGGIEDAAMDRIGFFARCAALEDLACGRPEHVGAAERSVAWLFPPAG